MSTINEKVMEYARTQVNKTVGRGECFDLADSALKSAGAKSAADFGTVTDDADYVWGDTVAIEKVQAGDLLQFRDYEMETATAKQVAIKFPDGSSLNYDESSTKSLTRPHHTAIVTSLPSQGSLTVLEQNVDRGRNMLEKTVNSATLAIRSQPKQTTRATERITISHAWGQQMKKTYSSPADKKFIDDLVKKYLGQVITADVQVSTSVTVKGTIIAYRPQSK